MANWSSLHEKVGQKPFIMTGLMVTDRDWYYVMIPEDGDLSGICMLSCVCDVQDFGYEKMRKKKEVENI